MADRKKMTVKEFRELGYLQELNRQFLHPLGMALEVIKKPNGDESFGLVWDSREDSEGFIYGDGMIDVEKAERIVQEMKDRKLQRFYHLGYGTQPIPKSKPERREDQEIEVHPNLLRTYCALHGFVNGDTCGFCELMDQARKPKL